MNTRLQLVCGWGGFAALILWGTGFLAFCGFIPPPSPSAGAEEISRIFQDDTLSIRTGLVLAMIGAALIGPFVAQISVLLRQIEGPMAPMSMTQLCLGALTVIEFIIPVAILQGAAFRPERAAETLQTLDDVGWLMFVGITSTFTLQLLAIGIGTLCDRHETPLMPRWSGYFNIWSAFLYCPSLVIVYFKTGPFAWDGVFAFWVPAVMFTAWVLVMTFVVRQATMRLAARPGIADELENAHMIDLLNAEVAALRDTIEKVSTSGALRHSAE